jgi:ribosome maturation protein Sdo1
MHNLSYNNVYITLFILLNMANVVARTKVNGKHYEIRVDLDEALKVKAGKGDITSALESNAVYYDLKEGNIASSSAS